MTDREALLAAVRSVPEDDLPRLVYADWLDENAASLPAAERESASERAAFIRAQVAAALAEPFSPAARQAGDRARLLLTAANRDAWTAQLRDRILDCSFERGFIEHVMLDTDLLSDIAAGVVAAEPIRSVQLSRRENPLDPQRELAFPFDFERELGPLFDRECWRQITALDLQNMELLHEDCAKLTESPHLAGLTHLGLRGNPIFPPWFRGALESDCWPNLTSLDLGELAHLGPAIAAAFRRARHRRFTRLDLSGIGFRSEDLKRTLGSECAAELEELRLRWQGGNIAPGPVTHLDLGWTIPWERLRWLDLDGQGLGSDGVRAIVQQDRSANLRWLGLGSNHLGADAVRLLTEESGLNLYYLDVRGNGLKFEHAVALRRRYPDARVMV